MHLNQELRFQYELSLFVFLSLLKGTIVFPANAGFALFASDIPYQMLACCHVAFVLLKLVYVHYVFEEEGLAMLTAEVLDIVSSLFGIAEEAEATHTAHNVFLRR